MLKIEGKSIKDPSSLSWSIADESSEESGRSTNNGKMHKDVIAQKRKLELSWMNPNKDEVSDILTSVDYSSVGAMFRVTYPDAMSGKTETRTFYVGDRSTPMKTWTLNNKIYSTLSFNLIEQ